MERGLERTSDSSGLCMKMDRSGLWSGLEWTEESGLECTSGFYSCNYYQIEWLGVERLSIKIKP